MTGQVRLDSEEEFHDQQAAKRAESFRTGTSRLQFADTEFLDHETWIRPAFDRLGLLKGKVALDYGCGHGMAAVVLARAGAIVTAFDLSSGYVLETQARAVANHVSVTCLQADAENLPFPDAMFDIVWGNAILHHLNLSRASQELSRIMRPGGIAVFCEPWGENPILRFARQYLPYPNKGRTVDERPLTRRDLKPLRTVFPTVEIQGFQIFGMVRRVWPNSALCKLSSYLDDGLLTVIPVLNNWCRYMIITMHKPGSEYSFASNVLK